jgi:hypothetical protein
VQPTPPPVYVPATPPIWSPEWLTYCAHRYPHSFDAHTGYFVGNDGQRYFCH